MTARSIRRAAERKAKKMARKAEMIHVGQVVNLQADCQSAAVVPATISEAQLAANRANSQFSTGPTSETGKAKSSLNAVKTGLDEAAPLSEPKTQEKTGRTVLLPADDAAEYERHIAAYIKEFHPVGQRECDLVQSIADTQWRLLRIPSLEAGIYALGRLEFESAFDDHDAALRSGMIEVKTYIAYERQLRNLHLQESRLQRRREKEIAELRALQSERQRKEAEDLEKVGQALSPGMSKTARPAGNGFVFSTGRIEQPISLASASEPVSSSTTQAHSRAA